MLQIRKLFSRSWLAGIVLLVPPGSALAFVWGPFAYSYNNVKPAQYIDLAPVLSPISPANKAFGSVEVGGTQISTFTIANTGTGDAEDITITAKAAPFRVYSSTTFRNLSSGKSLTYRVAYTPSAAVFSNSSTCYSAPNIAKVCAGLSGTGTVSDPYTYLLKSYWDGSGVTDTGGTGTGMPWTTSTGSNSSVVSSQYTVTLAASSAGNYLSKTGLTAKNEVQAQVDVSFSTLTQPSTNSTQIMALRSGSAAVASVYISASATTMNRVFVKWQNGANTSVSSTVTAFAYSAGTPYTVVLQFKESTNTSTSDGYYRLLINGAEVIPQTAINTLEHAAISVVRVGALTSDLSQTNTYSFDNFLYGWK